MDLSPLDVTFDHQATLLGIKSHAPFGSPIFKFYKIISKYLVVFLILNLSSANRRTCDLTQSGKSLMRYKSSDPCVTCGGLAGACLDLVSSVLFCTHSNAEEEKACCFAFAI